jgi:hypothetical protein
VLWAIPYLTQLDIHSNNVKNQDASGDFCFCLASNVRGLVISHVLVFLGACLNFGLECILKIDCVVPTN